VRVAILTVQAEDGESWTERYVESDGQRTFKPGEDVQRWAERTIDYFNATLRNGERRRTLVKVEIEEPKKADVQNHAWAKTNLVTLSGARGYHDTVSCANCGITAKRYGLTNIVLDAEYRAKAFKTCTGAKALLAKREAKK
jgi:hypothetical protein